MLPDNLNAEDRDLLQRVETAVRAQRLSDAVALSRVALDKGLEHPLLLNLRAYWHESEGRFADGLADLRRAFELAPEDPSILNALGLAAGRNGRFVESRDAFARAAVLAPLSPAVHFNLGWALETLGDLDGARSSYERVLSLSPGQPGAYVRLASLAGRRADWTQARSYADRALQIQGDEREAKLVLAKAELAAGEFAKSEKQLSELLAVKTASVDERHTFWEALGNVRDTQGRYEEAFAAYRAGNEEMYAANASRFPAGETARGVVRWMTSLFQQARPWRPVRLERDPVDNLAHVFLVGFPRSGTTLLEQVLNGHPRIASLEEKELFADSARAFMTDAAGLDRLSSAGEEERLRFRSLYWQRAREYGAEIGAGKVFVDKLPFNVLKLPLVAALFPEAKVIFALRDPRDVVLSCFRQHFRINAYTIEFLRLESAASFYAEYMALAMLVRDRLALVFSMHRHEDLVADLETEARRICDVIGVPWVEEMRGFADRTGKRTISTPSAAQIARGLNAEGIARWRRYREQMTPVLAVLHRWVEQFGYPPD